MQRHYFIMGGRSLQIIKDISNTSSLRFFILGYEKVGMQKFSKNFPLNL